VLRSGENFFGIEGVSSESARWAVKVLGTDDDAILVNPENLGLTRVQSFSWTTVELSATEHAAVLLRGEEPPMIAGCGLKLRVRREQCAPWTGHEERDAELDNQPITFLMIEGDSGFARMPWQGNVGQCIVARPAGDFTNEDFELLNEYTNMILDQFGDAQPERMPTRITPAAFQRCVARIRVQPAQSSAELVRLHVYVPSHPVVPSLPGSSSAGWRSRDGSGRM